MTVFQEGDAARPVKLSELFGDKSVLLLYSYMYGPAMAQPCPSCTSILDGLDGQVHHIEQRVAIAVVARSPIARVRAMARERGWRRLRLLLAGFPGPEHQLGGVSVTDRTDGIAKLASQA